MRTKRRYLASAIVAAVCAASALPAFAAPEDPRRMTTSPSDRAFVKSVNVPFVSATYDRVISAPPVSQIQVLDKNDAAVPGTSRLADDQRTLIFTPTFPFKDQTSNGPVNDRTIEYTVQLLAVTPDRSGSAGTQFTFTVDDIAPIEPIVAAPEMDAWSRATDVLFEGGAEPRARITLREGTHAFGPLEVSPQGGWFTTEPFSQGPHTVLATTTDQAGNSSARDTRIHFIVDSIAPSQPVVSTPAEGAVSHDGVLTFAGTGPPGASIAIREAANERGRVTVGSTGAWSLDIPFSNGPHTIDVVALDAAGNASTPTPAITFSVEIAGPPSVATPAANSSVGATSVVVAGGADAGATVDVTEGTTLLAHIPAQPNGTWSATIVFSEGRHVITATSTDPDATIRSSAARAFTVDLTPPATPVFTYPDRAYTNLDPLPLAGRGEPGTSVRVFDAGVQKGVAVTGGSGSWSILTSLPEGTHTLEATATDAAGNTSARGSLTLTIDRQRPVDTITTADNSILTTDLTVTGQASDNVGVARVVAQFVDARGTLASTITAALVADPEGGVRWTVDAKNVLPGIYRVSAFASDRAGNVGGTAPVTIVLL